MLKSTILYIALTLFCTTAIAQEKPRALTLSAEDLSGEILKDKPVVDFFGNDSQIATVFESEDEQFMLGVFSWTVEEKENGIYEYEDFRHNEVMFFLEGSMTLIDEDGNEITAGPGEVLFIPKGWKGTRIADDMRKVSVIYKGEPVGPAVTDN